jgi:hypothetical protein
MVPLIGFSVFIKVIIVVSVVGMEVPGPPKASPLLLLGVLYYPFAFFFFFFLYASYTSKYSGMSVPSLKPYRSMFLRSFISLSNIYFLGLMSTAIDKAKPIM